MKPWLLLVSLLVSDLSLLGDGDWIIDYIYRPLCRKLLLDRLKAPTAELQTVSTRAVHSCWCLPNGVYVAEQQEQRSASFHWRLGVLYSNQDLTRIIHGIHFPALAVAALYGPGKHFPAFLMKSNALPALHVKNKPIHTTMDVIINSPSFWLTLLHHSSTTSGHNFPVFLLEKSKLSWAEVSDAELHKLLPEGGRAATVLIIICCSEDGKMKLVKRIKKTKIRQEERAWQTVDPKPTQSRLQTVHLLNPKDDSEWQKTFWKEPSLKAASSKDAKTAYIEGQPLLASRKNKGSIYRPPYAMRPALDDDMEYFRERKEAELHPLQPERQAETLNTNREKNGNQQILVHGLEIQHPYEGNDYDASLKNRLSDVTEEAFIILIPHAEMETQAERSTALSNEIRWEAVKRLSDLRPFTKYLKDFVSKTDKSKCESFLKLFLIDTTEMTELTRAKTSAVTTVSAATEKTETAGENVAASTTSEAGTTAEESVIPSPPSIQETRTETTTAGGLTEATTIRTESRETAQALGQSSTTDNQPSGDQRQTTVVDPELEREFKPRLITCLTHNPPSTSEVQFSGLRMRDEAPVITSELDKDPEKHEESSANWAAADRKHGLILKEGADKDVKTAKSTAPLCRGLIDRTEDGWKHCRERQGGSPSELLPVWETPAAGKLDKDPMTGINPNPLSDEDDHFYYFNGVLKRVQNNQQIYYNRQRRRRHSFGSTDHPTRERKGQPRENLQSYIQRLTEKKKADPFT